MMKMCRSCGGQIPAERIEALPNTQECVACSSYKKPLVLMDQQHKTAAYAVIIDTNGSGANERVRIAQRAFRRAR